MPDGRPRKLQRASRACDFCHKRSIRCRGSESDAERCQNCVDFDITCAYTRPWRRARGSNPAVRQSTSSVAQSTPSDSHPSPAQPHHHNQTPNTAHQLPSYTAPPSVEPAPRKTPDRQLVSYTRDPLGEAWKSFAMACGSSIRSLMEIYHQIVYPIFPFFHRETLLRNLQQREYLNDRGYFASIMAACSIVASRARDGALAPWITRRAQLDDVPAETFYSAAKDAIQKVLPGAMGLHYLRACALVAIASIQFGKIETLHEYKGHYFTLCAIQRFSDEAHWPKDITPIEREERRRLFWSTYTLDVYSSIVWSGPMYSREAHYHVRYPAEADGHQLDVALTGLTDPACWMHGWNFTTDLYRVLEHTIYHLAGIGTILGSVMESPLSEASYQHVRSMLLSMADLLESLESGLYRTQGTSRGLRSQVDRIDEYMRMQRNAMPQTPFQNTIADLTAAVPTHRTPLMPASSLDTISQFQLPPELLEDWPWPSDLSQQDFGIVPFGFE
ncbi:putative zn 2cys6 transcription factor [Diplodia seriata]|uniref:Putative zn 2cys6 transcription factor n=1 Tax=Diplodia seriata TaxID=420778 RepID=A0A0G2F396_9PEZI|nr:putative zn 2cys6 transcription factor [Diplodia seriata]